MGYLGTKEIMQKYGISRATVKRKKKKFLEWAERHNLREYKFVDISGYIYIDEKAFDEFYHLYYFLQDN